MIAWRLALLSVSAGPLFVSFALLYTLLYVPRRLLRALARRRLAASLEAAGGGMPLPLLLCEVPLALISYAAYESVKLCVSPLIRAVEESRHGTDTAWVDKLYKNIVSPGRMPRGAVFAAILWGPRWNTHTNVHFVRLAVAPEEEEHTFEVENVSTPYFSWQILAYDQHQTTIGRLAAQRGGPPWLRLTVRAAGAINLSIRPYAFGDRASAPLPRVRLDGVEVGDGGAPVEFKRERLDFNFSLRRYESPLYWALQWHVYPLLCARELLPAALVRAVYLPVGNPETQWLYGPVHEGYALRFETSAEVLAEHLVFCTVYDRASFPTLPCGSIEMPSVTLDASLEDGFWAMRVVRKDGATTDPAVLARIAVSLVAARTVKGSLLRAAGQE